MNAMVERLRRKYPCVRFVTLCYATFAKFQMTIQSLIEAIIMIDCFRYSFHYVRDFLIEIYFYFRIFLKRRVEEKK